MPEGSCLLGDGFDEVGMAMAEDAGAESGEEVEVSPAVGVVEFAPASAHDGDGETGIVERHEAVMRVGDPLSDCIIRGGHGGGIIIAVSVMSKATWRLARGG